jgi:hypothetical protein
MRLWLLSRCVDILSLPQDPDYTWPRLGFDKRLTAEEKTRLSPELAHMTYLREAMEHTEESIWWRDHGFAVEVTLDTSLKSYSVQRLNAALVDLKQRNAYWDSGQDMPLRVKRGSALRLIEIGSSGYGSTGNSRQIKD